MHPISENFNIVGLENGLAFTGKGYLIQCTYQEIVFLGISLKD